jgi:hypothetical protein
MVSTWLDWAVNSGSNILLGMAILALVGSVIAYICAKFIYLGYVHYKRYRRTTRIH